MRNKWKIGLGLFLIVVVLVAQAPVSQGPQASNAAAWLTSVTTWATGTLGAMANYGTSPGAVLVPGVNAFVTNSVTVSGTVTANAGTGPFPTAGAPQTSATYAASACDITATSIAVCKASPGNVYGWYGQNPNVTTCFLQFYNASSGAVLGTSALHPFGVVAGGTFNMGPGTTALFNLSTGISVGEATTGTGGSACSSPMLITLLYD